MAATKAKPARKAASPATATEPSGKKQASRRSQATPMLPKVRLTAEVTAGG